MIKVRSQNTYKTYNIVYGNNHFEPCQYLLSIAMMKLEVRHVINKILIKNDGEEKIFNWNFELDYILLEI
jgi:hypothetical protein